MRRRALMMWAMSFCGIAFAAGDVPTVLLDSPVKITVQVNAQKTMPGVTALDLAIDQVTHEFRLSVMQRGNANDAVAALRARTGWKDGFLFIRDDCMEKNDPNRSVRCVLDQVFVFVNEFDPRTSRDVLIGKRFVNVGEVFAGEDCIDDAKFGCALYKGYFTDIYDALDNNMLVSRADSPALLIEMRAINGDFVVDLDETWGRNQERFTAGERCLSAKPAARAEFCVEGINPRRAFLFNSALAMYTKRPEVLEHTRQYARIALCQGKAGEEMSEADCGDILRRSAVLLAAIRPGDKPRLRGNVKSIPIGKTKETPAL